MLPSSDTNRTWLEACGRNGVAVARATPDHPFTQLNRVPVSIGRLIGRSIRAWGQGAARWSQKRPAERFASSPGDSNSLATRKRRHSTVTGAACRLAARIVTSPTTSARRRPAGRAQPQASMPPASGSTLRTRLLLQQLQLFETIAHARPQADAPGRAAVGAKCGTGAQRAPRTLCAAAAAAARMSTRGMRP